jgi:hypothetical protein
MRHAGPATLATIAPLLERIRRHPELAERSPGVFWRRRQAFLHFHEDPAGLFADLKVGRRWHRFPLGRPVGEAKLLARVARLLQP